MPFFDLISFLFLRNYLLQRESQPFSSMSFNTRCFVRYTIVIVCSRMKYPFQIYKTFYIRPNVYEAKRFSKRFIGSIPFQFRFLYRCQFLLRHIPTYVLQFQNTISIMRSISFGTLFETYRRMQIFFFFFFFAICKVCSRDALKQRSITIFF